MRKYSNLILGILMAITLNEKALCTSSQGELDDKIAISPLRHKIGQMIMVGMHGTTPQDVEVQSMRTEIEEGRIGGVIFFSYNIVNPEQTQLLTQALTGAKSPLSPLPTFIALDQEGGRVQRLKKQNGFTDYASAWKVAHTKSVGEAQDYYKGMAKDIKSAGFNFNFSPVVDLHSLESDLPEDAACPVIGRIERSFSSGPDVVIAYAKAFITAHHEEGLLTSIKHYPGHGLASNDSHKGLVDITDSYNLKEREPFQKLVEQGIVDSVMIAHLVHRKLDPEYPSTLSEHFIGPWLRQEDRFQGVVITDDLHMGAINDHYQLKEIVLRAIKAGNDLLVFSNNSAASQGKQKLEDKDAKNLAERVINIVEQAIAEGELTESRINESFHRIVSLKQRLLKVS